MVDQVQGGGFQTGEAHIVGILPGLGTGQRILRFISQPGCPVQGSATGVRHSQHPGHLVKALPRRVIQGGTQDVHVGVVLHFHDHGMAAGDHQAQKGRLQLRISQVIGRDVAPDVMDRDQRLPQGQSGGFGEIHPHQHRTDEARRVGHGHGVDFLPGKLRLLQRLIREAVNGLDVLAGGNLRYHASVDPVQVHLGGNAVAQDLPSVPDNGHSGFIAGGFNC